MGRGHIRCGPQKLAHIEDRRGQCKLVSKAACTHTSPKLHVWAPTQCYKYKHLSSYPFGHFTKSRFHTSKRNSLSLGDGFKSKHHNHPSPKCESPSLQVKPLSSCRRPIEVARRFNFFKCDPFDQHICWVLANINILNSQVPISENIMMKMISQLNMFGLGVKCLILGERNFILTVIVVYTVVASLAQLLGKSLQPDHFLCYFNHTKIFSFYGWKHYYFLQVLILWYCSTFGHIL